MLGRSIALLIAIVFFALALPLTIILANRYSRSDATDLARKLEDYQKQLESKDIALAASAKELEELKREVDAERQLRERRIEAYARHSPVNREAVTRDWVVAKKLEEVRREVNASLVAMGRRPSPPIVYNADISPQLPRDKAAPNRPVLQAGHEAALRFAIGPKWDNSLLSDATPSSEILESAADLPLTVILSCDFCEPRDEPSRRMTYRPKQGLSDEIRFQFTPQRRPDGSEYTDQLQVGIIDDKTGREYDRIVIDVGISDAPVAPVVGANNVPMAFTLSRVESRTDWAADVVLYANEEMKRNVTIEIEPLSDELKRRLGLAFDPQGVRRKFRANFDEERLVEAMTTSAYGVMSAVSTQSNLLTSMKATGMYGAVSPGSRGLLLTEEESRNITDILGEIGQDLYFHLFNSPDVDLRRLIVELEKAAAEPRNRPLRLRIATNGISLPWQYLHPLGEDVAAENFWGLRFSLSVYRNNTNAPGNALSPKNEQAHKLLFARYGSSGDASVPLARKQVEQLRALPVQGSNLLEVDSGADLLANLKQERREISAIFTFLHATYESDDSEPHLKFNEGDHVTSRVLEGLLRKLPMELGDDRLYLTSAPLVILNACATGPSVNLPHRSLQNAMFRLGATGVVATEVSVWTELGHEMATRLIKRLGRGEAISDALTAIRRDLVAEGNNPLGLLYLYYGDPAATLRY